MSRNTIIGIVVIAAMLVGGFYVYSTQGSVQPTPDQERVGIANPASTNCVTLGGTLEIMDASEGQSGYCHLPDGRVCEEWALFRDGLCKTPN